MYSSPHSIPNQFSRNLDAESHKNIINDLIEDIFILQNELNIKRAELIQLL